MRSRGQIINCVPAKIKTRSREIAFTGTPNCYEKILFAGTATARTDQRQRTQASQQAKRRWLWNDQRADFALRKSFGPKRDVADFSGRELSTVAESRAELNSRQRLVGGRRPVVPFCPLLPVDIKFERFRGGHVRNNRHRRLSGKSAGESRLEIARRVNPRKGEGSADLVAEAQIAAPVREELERVGVAARRVL